MNLFVLRYDFSAGGGPTFGVTLEEVLDQSSDVMAVVGFYKKIYNCEPTISKWENPDIKVLGTQRKTRAA